MFSSNGSHLIAFAVVWFLLTLGCSQPADDVSKNEATSELSIATHLFNEPVSVISVPREDGPNEESYCGLHNLIQVTDKIYSGGEPHSDEAFADLARLGVKTVVSVDGAKPNVATARKYGLRYVHIPIGYDGVEKEAGLSLARLVRETDGPFFIHCHHGRHRSPAAAAIACVASGVVDGKGALKILERAGTSKEYAGLWRDVENYHIPSVDAELPELVDVAKVGSFAAAMAKIDRAYDNLKQCRDANWATPEDHPDLVPAQEALLLKEGLRESGRNLADERAEEFNTWLTEAEALAQKLENTLKANNDDDIPLQFQSLKDSCKRCHEKYRN